jgi:hypothetical protein
MRHRPENPSAMEKPSARQDPQAVENTKSHV